MEYVKPSTIIVKAETEVLLLGSGVEAEPSTTDIGAPNVDNDTKSVWDEVKQLNHKEESYEDKVHE